MEDNWGLFCPLINMTIYIFLKGSMHTSTQVHLILQRGWGMVLRVLLPSQRFGRMEGKWGPAPAIQSKRLITGAADRFIRDSWTTAWLMPTKPAIPLGWMGPRGICRNQLGALEWKALFTLRFKTSTASRMWIYLAFVKDVEGSIICFGCQFSKPKRFFKRSIIIYWSQWLCCECDCIKGY